MNTANDLLRALRAIQVGRIEYEAKTSVYTQISPLKIRGKDEYILIYGGHIFSSTDI
jgi:hypothetical protein